MLMICTVDEYDWIGDQVALRKIDDNDLSTDEELSALENLVMLDAVVEETKDDN